MLLIIAVIEITVSFVVRGLISGAFLIPMAGL